MIRVALVGIGNVAAAFLQGIERVRGNGDVLAGVCKGFALGCPEQIDVVAAFDVAPEKIGRDIAEAAIQEPNCVESLTQLSPFGVRVTQGVLLDRPGPALSRFVGQMTGAAKGLVSNVLVEAGAEVVLILLPSGYNKSAKFYALESIAAGCSVINGMAAELAKDDEIVALAGQAGVTLIGDDVRSQLGATVLHQRLNALFAERGCVIKNSLQFDWGGDADFMNLACDGQYLNGGKRAAKKRAVLAATDSGEALHMGLVDWVPFMGGTKEALIRTEGRIYGGGRVSVEIRLVVDDAFNSAGVLVDAVRAAYLCRLKGISGIVVPACSLFCKSPPAFLDDLHAKRELAKLLGLRL